MNKQSSGVALFFSRMEPAGAELRMIDIANSIGSSFDFYAVSGDRGTLDAQLVREGHRVFHWRMSPLRFRELVRTLRRNRTRVVHSNLGLASGLIVVAAYLAGVPLRMVHFRSDAAGGAPSLRKRAKLSASKLLIRLFATNIVGVSPSALSGNWALAWQTDQRCEVVPNGIRVTALRERAEIASIERRGSAGGIVIVNVGRIEPSKNRGRSIEVWAQLARKQPSTLILVGALNDRDMGVMEKARRALPAMSEIIYVGETSDVAKYLGGSDVLLTTSLREGLPGVVLEALAVGVPVVSSSLPGVEWIAESVVGVSICKLEDSDELWAERVVEAAASNKSDIRQSFDKSPFVLERVVPAYLNLWNLGAPPKPCLAS